MRAISIKQPWAHAIATGRKVVENRVRPHPWRSAVGEVLAVHSSLGADDNARGHPAMIRYMHALRTQGGWTENGAVLATVRLVDVHQACDGCCDPTYAQADTWHLVLDDVRPLTVPIGCRGALGLWTVPQLVERSIGFQLTTLQEAREDDPSAVTSPSNTPAHAPGLFDLTPILRGSDA